MKNNRFEIVTTTAGARSIRNIAVNEIMHNPVGPWVEAKHLYVDQSRLCRRFKDGCKPEFVLFDVGLGAASNAVAAMTAVTSLLQDPHDKTLKLISFENDLDLLRFTLTHSAEFSHYRGYEVAIKTLLTNGEWSAYEGRLKWQLRAGDFTKLISCESEIPDMIYFDPYSPSVNPEMWSASCFKDLFSLCQKNENGASMYTYSVATSIRSAMLAAGFYVGYGTATGLKEETTQAATTIDHLDNPLDARWIVRWLRSHRSMPSDISVEQAGEFTLRIMNHPQFHTFRFQEPIL